MPLLPRPCAPVRALGHAIGAGMLIAASVPVGAQPLRALLTPTAGIPATAPVPPRALTEEDLEAGTLRVSPVRFDRSLHAELQRAFAGDLEAPARMVTVTPFPGVTFTLVLRRSAAARALSSDVTVLSGEAQLVEDAGTPTVQSAQRLLDATSGATPGRYTLVLHGGELSLSILSPAGNYHVHPGEFGRLEAFQEDPAAPMRCANVPGSGRAAAASATAAAGSAPLSAAEPTDRSEIVVLVLHTDDAVSALGGNADALQAELAKGIDLLDASLRNSDVRATIRLATGRALPAPSSLAASPRYATAVEQLRASPEVAELRRRHGADLVLLVRGRGDAWSVSAQTAAPDPTSAGEAFGVVYARKLADGLGLAHTIGHLLGARHNPENVDAGGALPYARGWHGALGVDTRRATHVGGVMSFVGQRIPYFSSPRVRYQGVPVGSAQQDNAQAMNRARAAVAAYQP